MSDHAETSDARRCFHWMGGTLEKAVDRKRRPYVYCVVCGWMDVPAPYESDEPCTFHGWYGCGLCFGTPMEV